MYKRHTLPCLLVCILTLIGMVSNGVAQSLAAQWTRFEQNEANGLNMEANDILDTLEATALREHDTLQLFRVHFERSILLNSYDKNHEKSAIFYTDSVMRRFAAPYHNLYEIMLYQYLLLYYKYNQNILNKRAVPSDTTLANFEQWNIDIIRNAIIRHRQASQTDGNILKKYPLRDFLFLFPDTLPTYKYESATLYDFVFGQTIDTTSEYHKAVHYYEMGIKSNQNNDWLIEAHKLFTKLLGSSKSIERHNAEAYLRAIEQQYVKIPEEISNNFHLATKLLMPIEYRNIDTLYVTCLKTTRNQFIDDEDDETYFSHNNSKNKHPNFSFHSMTWLTSKDFNLLRTERFILPNKHNYCAQSTDLFLDSLSNGNYLIVFHNNPMIDTNSLLLGIKISVCDKSLICEGLFKAKKHYRVVKATSGVQVPKVKILAQRYNINLTRHSNADGIFSLPDKYYYLCIPASKNSIIWKSSYYPSRDYYRGLRYSFYYWSAKHEHRRTTRNNNCIFFTDRVTYRPGQKLYFKAICHKKGKNQVLTNKDVNVFIRSSHEIGNIDSMQLITNAFGSVDSCFVLSKDLQPGNYVLLIRSKNHAIWESCYFNVEEYKRPSFELSIDTIKDVYTLGDTINLWGKATYYSGLPVPNATAQVYIQNINTEWSAITNSAGYFHVAIPTEHFPKELLNHPWIRVYADITVSDLNGETQTCQKKISVAGDCLTLEVNAPMEHVNTITDSVISFSFSLKNQDDAIIPNTFHVSIYRLDVPEHKRILFSHVKPTMPIYTDTEYQRYFPTYSFNESECNPNKFKILSTVWEETTTNSNYILNVQNWITGTYKMLVQVTDPHGKLIQDSTVFTLVGNGPFKQTASICATIFDNIDSTFKKRGMLHYSIGSSTIPNAHIYYHILYDGKVVKQGHYIMTDTLLTDSVSIKISSKAIHGEAKIMAYTLYYNHLYTMTDTKYGYYDNALLDSLKNDMRAPMQIHVEHINDMLNPGNQETWSFTITGKDSTQHLEAEMAAVMYDASLDPLSSNHWYHKTSFKEFDNNMSFINRCIQKRKYRPLWSNSSKISLAPTLFSNAYSVKKQTKTLSKPSFWNSQLPSTRIFTTGSHNINSPLDAIIIGHVTDMNGDPIAYCDLYLYTMDDIVINNALTDKNGNYTIRGVPFGRFSLKADATNVWSCRKSVCKIGINVSDNHIHFIDFTIDCDTSDTYEATICYKPLVFDADMTVSTSVRGNRADGTRTMIDGMIVRSTPGRSITNTLSSMEGVTSVDGEISSVRGKRGDQGQETSDIEKPATTRQELLGAIQPRTDFAETAFFLPKLRTDDHGSITFQFTAPDQLTRWHFAALAHTKDRHITAFTQDIYTQRSLMVIPNAPRFLREGDTLQFRSTILATGRHKLHGDARLEMWDTLSKQHLTISHSDQPFQCDSTGSALAAWTVAVPQDVRNLQYRLAAAGTMTGFTFSDAETRNISVLPKTIDLNEAIPFYVAKDSNACVPFSFTMKGKRSLNISTHPTWAIYQTLPYIINSRHECNDELMYKYFANTLAKRYLIQNTLLLQKSELDEQNRTLFDTTRIRKDIQQLTRKLQQRMTTQGGWSWINSDIIDKYITTRLVTHIGQLILLGETPSLKNAAKKALLHLCEIEKEEYTRFIEDTTLNKEFYFESSHIQFLYALSYYTDGQKEWLPQSQLDFYLEQAEKHYKESNLHEKAMIALSCYRLGRSESAAQWAEALRQQAHVDNYGLSWTELRNCQRGWKDISINTEALLMELLYETLSDTTDTQKTLKDKTLSGITQWLLAQRTTNHWGCNSTNTAACFALALYEKNFNTPTNKTVQNIVIRFGDSIIYHPDTLLCGTYELNNSENNSVIIENLSTDAVYGCACMQYQQTLDSINAFGSEELKINRTLHHRNGQGQWEEIRATDTLHVGDIITVRFFIENARNMDYVNICDMRACALEPTTQISQWNRNGDFRWYESPHDNTTEFYITHLERGKHVLEYTLKVTQIGNFQNGTATIESMMAPEFTAHSDSPRLKIGNQ